MQQTSIRPARWAPNTELETPNCIYLMIELSDITKTYRLGEVDITCSPTFP